MIESTQNIQNQQILRMRTSERTAGSMPTWEKATSPKGQIEAAFSRLDSNTTKQVNSSETLAFQPKKTLPATTGSFGFADLLDMVNPLQHIPIVSHFYREWTGDTIKPASQIMGGAVFGGAAGAASGLINVIIAEETGSDFTQNAWNFAKTGEIPTLKTQKTEQKEQRTASYAPPPPIEDQINSWENPEIPQKINEKPDLPASLLAFSKPAAHTEVMIKQTKQPAFKSFTLNG